MAQSVVTLRALMRFYHLTYIFLLFVAATTSWAQNVEKRVLFIVETSKESKPLAEAERKLVSALVLTGLGGLLETNDTFGIWTFNEALYYGKFPVQRWSQETAKRMAGRAEEFLKAQPYEKAAKFDSIRPALGTVVETSPALMIVLVTSGKQAIVGTPFDAEINKELKSAYKSYQKQKTPAVVMLSSTSGKIQRYSVNPAIGDVRVPLLTMPTNTVAKVTPPPTKKPIITALAPVPTPPARSENALVITKDGAQTVSVNEANHVAAEIKYPAPGAVNGSAVVEENTAVLPPTIISTSESTETFTPQVVPTLEATLTPPPVEQVPPQPIPEPAPAAPVVEVVEVIVPPPAPAAQVEPQVKPTVAVVEPPRPTPQPVPAVVVPPQPAPAKIEVAAAVPEVPTPTEPVASQPANTVVAETSPAPSTVPVHAEPILAQTTTETKRSSPFLIAAAGLIVIAVALAFLIGRKIGRKPQQSLVSDWAERDRLKKD